MPETKAHALLLGLIFALAGLTYSSARMEGIFHHATLFIATLTAINVALYREVKQTLYGY